MATATQAPPLSKEFALGYRDMMLESLRQEMATTRKVIEAIPDAKRDYRPDPKARTAWELAWHIVDVEMQFGEGIANGAFAMDDKRSNPCKNARELSEWYGKNFPAVLEKLKAMKAEQLTKVIDFYGAFHFPAVIYLAFLLSHSIHHRGQLSTYLRPMGSKIPSIYGGSADEPWQG
jgi:uncharacterized damage-inducible protein DinB